MNSTTDKVSRIADLWANHLKSDLEPLTAETFEKKVKWTRDNMTTEAHSWALMTDEEYAEAWRLVPERIKQIKAIDAEWEWIHDC